MTQSPPSYPQIIKDGLWLNNAGLVQLLGLCPLLAISNTALNALALGMATTLVLLASNSTVSMLRRWIRPDLRLPMFVLIIAAFVTAIELLMQAYVHALHGTLGIFLPLIVTNCMIVGRAETFASKHSVPRAALDGLAVGLGFALVLIALGGLRELIGQGTLLNQAQEIFGPQAEQWMLDISAYYRGFLLAALAPGAFIGLGLLVALKNVLHKRRVES